MKSKSDEKIVIIISVISIIGTIIFGLIISSIYMIYLYILENNIYRYIIYLVAIIMLFILQKLIKTDKYKKVYDIMIMLIFSVIATNEIIFIASAVFALIIYLISYLITKRKNTNYIFYFSFLNILFLIIYNFIFI